MVLISWFGLFYGGRFLLCLYLKMKTWVRTGLGGFHETWDSAIPVHSAFGFLPPPPLGFD